MVRPIKMFAGSAPDGSPVCNASCDCSTENCRLMLLANPGLKSTGFNVCEIKLVSPVPETTTTTTTTTTTQTTTTTTATTTSTTTTTITMATTTTKSEPSTLVFPYCLYFLQSYTNFMWSFHGGFILDYNRLQTKFGAK